MCDKRNIFHQDFSILEALPENEILKVFRKCDEVCKQKFYFKILSEVKISIINRKFSNLLKSATFLSCMKNEVSTLNNLAYRSSPNNPLRNVNLIILAYKYSQPEVLDLIISDKYKILEHWPITVYGNAILPTDIDEYQHNDFYYAVRSGKTRVFEILKQIWPNEYKCKKSEKFCDALSNAYLELKRKNVELSIEMEYFVRNEIFEKDFYDYSQIHEPGQKTNKDIKNHNSKTQTDPKKKQNYISNHQVETQKAYKPKEKYISNQDVETNKVHKKKKKYVPNPNVETKKTPKQKQKDIAKHKVETQKADPQFKEDIAKRIELVLSSIETLKRDFAKIDVDETFLVIAKFVAKIIPILKLQLKFTYDKIPWEEIEFCLVIFVQTATGCQEIPLLQASNLTKEKILSYLEMFANCITNTQNLINETNEQSLKSWPDLKVLQAKYKEIKSCRSVREACELRIVQINPLLEDLYKDYERLRDEYSLKIMRQYLDIAISVESDEMERIVISRTLQVVGENLKNTLESPKLSDRTCELLLHLLPENTRKVVTDLRESLSHDSMGKRIEIEAEGKEFFKKINDDLKKMNMEILNVLCHFKTRMIRDNLKKIINCENEEEAKEMLKSWRVFESTVEIHPLVPELSVFKKMENFLKDLSCSKIMEKTKYDVYIIDKIINTIDLEKNRLEKIHITFSNIMQSYNNFLLKCQMENSENIIKEAKTILVNFFLEINDSGLRVIIKLFNENLHDLKSKCIKKDQVEIEFFICELERFAAFELRKIQLIEEYNLDMRKSKRTLDVSQTQTKIEPIYIPHTNTDMISEKLEQLKKTEFMFKDLTSFKNNRKYQVVVEMLVLDIFSLLVKCLSYNHLFLDAEPVTLIGSNMRNHLAHENLLISILPSCTLIDLALNAQKILAECTVHNPGKIGKVFRCNVDTLQSELDKELSIVARQKEMFVALSNGDLETLKNTLQKGADIQARYMKRKPAMHFASEGTSIETVKLVMGEKCEYDAKDENDQSAVHIAARHGRSEIVEYLLNHHKKHIKNRTISIFVDHLDKEHKTPLHIAAEHGHMDVVEVLLNSGASTTIKDLHGYSPLHYSIRNNHQEIVKALLNKEDNIDENDAFSGETPLFIASWCGHLELVNYLIEKRSKVNAKTDTMGVPLHAAVAGSHLETAKTLIEKGALVNARDMYGLTALHFSSMKSNESILRLLLGKETNVDDVLNISKRSPLSFAAQHGHIKIVKLLLEHNAKVDTKDVTEKTPLHFAAENGHHTVVAILISKKQSLAEKKSFLEEKDLSGWTALHYSASNGHESVVSLLINEGSSIDCIDIRKNTPLILAVRNTHSKVTKVLIDRNADINHTNMLNETALLMCFGGPCLDIAELLIERKANFHVKGFAYDITPFQLALALGSNSMLKAFIKGGAKIEDIKTTSFTALHLGIINGDLEVIEHIIDLNCDVNAPSKSGLTALHLAVQQSNIDVIELLCQKGLNLNVKDNKGYTPLHYAVFRNNERIIKYLIEKEAITESELLILAVMNGLHDVLAVLLKKGTFYGNVLLENTDVCLLHRSIFFHHKKVAELLLEKGADVNAKRNNTTPLFSATAQGDFEMVKLLLDKGADPNFPSGEEEITPLYSAVKKGLTEIVKILLEKGATKIVRKSTNKSATQLAVLCRRIEILNFLLENKHGDVNETFNGFSLLYIAVTMKELGIVKCLVAKGADINARSVNDETPIFVAVKSGQKDIIEFLLKLDSIELHRGDSAVMLNVENCGETFLHVASKFNQKYILLYFLEIGAYYNAKNQNGMTPLQVTKDSDIKCALQQVENVFKAIERNELELLNEAIEKGAILNAKSRENLTPLLFAAWKGRREILNVLLEKGANPNIIGKCKSTALHYAAKFEHFDVVRSLLSHGAIYNIQSETGKTPLEYSTNKDITRLLSLVDKSFKSVQIGKIEFLEELKTLNDPEEIEAVMKSRNKEEKLLVTSAMSHDFPEIEQLRNILKVDIYSMCAAAKEHHTLGNYLESLKLTECILKITSEALGHDHPETLDIKDNIGALLLEMKDFDKALKVLEENLKAREESFGVDHVSTLDTKVHLALTLSQLDKNAEALKIWQEVYSQQIRIYSESSSNVLAVQLEIADILCLVGKYEEALAQYRRNYDLFSELIAKNHPISISTQINIAMVLSALKKHDEAIKQLQHPYDTQKIIQGEENHPNISAILCKIAIVYLEAGNYDESLKIYKKVVHLQNTESKLNNLGYLKLLYNLGYALQLKRNYLEAFKVYTECYIKAKEWGLNHHLTKFTGEKTRIEHRIEFLKIQFSILYEDKGCCVLEQIENENRRTAEGGRISLEMGIHKEDEESRVSLVEERILQASEILLKLQNPNISKQFTEFPSLKYKEWNSEDTIENYITDQFSEISRTRAVIDGDELEETENSTKFIDKDVFDYMTQIKKHYLKRQQKLNNTEFM